MDEKQLEGIKENIIQKIKEILEEKNRENTPRIGGNVFFISSICLFTGANVLQNLGSHMINCLILCNLCLQMCYSDSQFSPLVQ